MAGLDDLLKNAYALDTTSIIAEVDKLEISDAQKGLLATTIVFERLGAQQRRFSYTTALASSEADCKPLFARSFVHADWQDGEDVVSAEGSNGDEGFNARFHKIENDFDALARDTAKAFECLMELRAQLAVMTEEIKAELNRINADIQALKPKTGGGTVLPPDVFVWPERPPYSVDPGRVGPAGPVPGGGIGPWVNPGTIWGGGYGPVVNPADPWIDTVPGWSQPGVPGGTVTPGAVWVPRGDGDIGLIGDLPARRIGETVFNNERVELWSTRYGTVLTPVAPTAAAGAGYVDPRLEMAGKAGAWLAGNDERIEQTFRGQAFDKAGLIREFGDADLGGGLLLRDVLRDVPAGTRFDSADAVINKVAEVQADAIVKAGAGTVAVIGSVGLNPGAVAPTDVAVETFTPLRGAEGGAVRDAGFATVGDLAGSSTAKVGDALGRVIDDPAAARGAAGRVRGMAVALQRIGARRGIGG